MTLKEIQKSVFLGSVPVSFEIEGDKMSYCLNVPRIIPLGVFVYHKFKTLIPEKCPDLWFSVDGNPVKCFVPTGVTYDLFAPRTDKVEVLKVFIHTSGIPEKTVQRCENEAISDFLFCHAFKESTFITNQNENLLEENQNLHQRILEASLSQNFDDFIALFDIKCSNVAEWKSLPIKIVKKEGKVQNCFVENKEGLSISEALSTINVDAKTVIIQGIEVPCETKVCDVIPCLLYPDGFLYVALQ